MQHHREVDGQGGEVRERVPRIHRQRGEEGLDLLQKPAVEGCFLVQGALVVVEKEKATLLELGQYIIQKALLHRIHLLVDGLGHVVEELGGSVHSLAARRAAVLQVGDARGLLPLEGAHPLGKELVEVPVHNGDEPEPLQEGGGLIHGHGKHAPIERDPRRLVVVHSVRLYELIGGALRHVRIEAFQLFQREREGDGHARLFGYVLTVRAQERVRDRTILGGAILGATVGLGHRGRNGLDLGLGNDGGGGLGFGCLAGVGSNSCKNMLGPPAHAGKRPRPLERRGHSDLGREPGGACGCAAGGGRSRDRLHPASGWDERRCGHCTLR
mmetsp:Transcript_16970/g.53906  ORF Transcript_16970/g.53906 Transcript_16970/m.53906 type:complete len:327 (+) Transcript_16970:779-1759(+)